MGGPTVTVRFATNRNRVGSGALFGDRFEGNDPARYVTGSIDVVRKRDLPDTGWEPDPTTLQIDPRVTPVTEATPAGAGATTAATGMIVFAAENALAKRDAPAKAGHGLVLLPGFASTFLDAMRRAAQIAHAYKASSVFCFSWPANGEVDRENYELDRADAEASAAAIADALAHFFAVVEVLPQKSKPVFHLVAHSMGVFALRHALQAIRVRQPSLLQRRVFDSALLMAGDDDFDGLSQPGKLKPLLTLARRVAVYHAGGDLALTLSEVINGSSRLGLWGPKNLQTLDGVTSINCSDVASTGGDNGESHFSHQYYRLSPLVIADVVQVIEGRRMPHQIANRIPDPEGDAGGKAFWIARGMV